MAGIAVGVLVVTGVTTVSLARDAAERSAVRNLERQAPAVQNRLQRLVNGLRVGSTGQPGGGVGRLITEVLRLTDGTVLSVGEDGTITEGVEALAGSRLGPDAPVAAGRRRPPSPPAGSGESGDLNRLPAGLAVEDFDAARLAAGESQSGAVGDRAFVAVPMGGRRNSTAVLVLTETIDASAITRARGFFLIGAALALAAAVVVSYLLARKLTRPLAVMGRTAGAIAGGDLSARVDLGDHPDDEFADLAGSLNRMAGGLEQVRASERQFLLSISHDLRTPLTSIRGYADALTDGTIPATEEQRRAGAVIAAESDRLARLVADLLDLARLDAHQFSLSPRGFDLAPDVRTAVDAFRPAATELGVGLEVETPETLRVVGDASRVAQIVANLVENALKFARTTIRVELLPGAEWVEIRVADDGPGVDPVEVHRVFERLYVSRSVPGRSVGTGLGLAIVGELSAAMGGSAAVSTEHGPGATFVVRLPRNASPTVGG